MSPEVEAFLSVMAMAEACGTDCSSGGVYVHDQLFKASTLLGNEVPMTPATRDAIAGEFPGASMVTADEADALFDENGFITEGVLISIAPLEELGDGVVAIDVGTVTARDGGHGSTVLFQWSGGTWVVVDGVDVGITTTSWVS